MEAIHPDTRIGRVALTVADLKRSVDYYEDAIGLALVSREAGSAVLGAGGVPLLELEEQTGALPWMVDGMTGLYHFAILVPTRGDLGRWLRHYFRRGYTPPGQGDHIVSEALYLRDPDGHGIEVYSDRPRSTWRWQNGRVVMGTGPVDIRGLLALAEEEATPWAGMPAGTTVGHIHLQVGDIAEAKRFYCDELGFDVVAAMDTALFVSAGGYHHHIGLNTWHSRGAGAAPSDTARLTSFEIVVPDGAEREISDPWGNRIRMRAASGAEAAPLRR